MVTFHGEVLNYQRISNEICGYRDIYCLVQQELQF